jgi:hypothetical protein
MSAGATNAVVQSNALSFNFEVDVISGGSILFATAGRLLRCMSDGVVDIYAVAASIEVSKLFPIGPKQEQIVRGALAKRNSKASILNSLLSVGWGHCGLVTGIARTRSGITALLVTATFAT